MNKSAPHEREYEAEEDPTKKLQNARGTQSQWSSSLQRSPNDSSIVGKNINKSKPQDTRHTPHATLHTLYFRFYRLSTIQSASGMPQSGHTTWRMRNMQC